MPLGQQFKEYREKYLHLKQKEAAYELTITPETLYNYERSERGLPVDLLPKLLRSSIFRLITDLGNSFKIRQEQETQPIQTTNELNECYIDVFIGQTSAAFRRICRASRVCFTVCCDNRERQT